MCKIAHVELIPARAPKFGKPDHPLPESVTATLDRKGIKNLFCHQAEALNAVAAGIQLSCFIHSPIDLHFLQCIVTPSRIPSQGCVGMALQVLMSHALLPVT